MLSINLDHINHFEFELARGLGRDTIALHVGTVLFLQRVRDDVLQNSPRIQCSPSTRPIPRSTFKCRTVQFIIK